MTVLFLPSNSKDRSSLSVLAAATFDAILALTVFSGISGQSTTTCSDVVDVPNYLVSMYTLTIMAIYSLCCAAISVNFPDSATILLSYTLDKEISIILLIWVRN